MTLLKNTGLVVCLSVSALTSSACNDDDDGGSANPVDSSVVGDSGTRSDASTSPGLDASVDASLDASIDSSAADASHDSATGPADASTGEPVQYSVVMSAAAEVPPCSSAPSTASGNATVLLDAAGDTLVFLITYSGLSGDVTFGHIHYGDASQSGPFVLPFTGSLANPIMVTLKAEDYLPKMGAPATFSDFITDLKAGKAYVNLHTTACGGGEIRGQIQ